MVRACLKTTNGSVFKQVPRHSRREAGSLVTEAIVAIAILLLAMFPLGYAFTQEYQLAHSSYRRAVAMEIVDGEMEILLAGEWRALPQGAQAYSFHAASAKNLPPGSATLTITGKHLRLAWTPETKASGGAELREADAK
jgi:hypothetical protein